MQAALQATVGDAYVVERELGAGGMAHVFLATERGGESRGGRRVAIKVLSPDVMNCCDADRFRREMAVAASLDHPNIVPLLSECDVCGDGLLFYFVMPYVEGETLHERLAREGALPVAEVVRILTDVAGALAHAHAAGVVHRDIKPANVLLARDRAHVADFGIAKALSSAARSGLGAPSARNACSPSDGADEAREVPPDLTSVGHMVGTPAYAAPEQALGDAATDHRADLYALGVLAYEMLTGAPPFADSSAMAVIAAHVSEAPPPLVRPGVPKALTTLVLRLLEKRPEMRLQSAVDVLHALHAIERETFVRRGLWLNYATIGYNSVEAVVALVAGLLAGSIALVGFGLDSVIEVTAAGAAQWRLRSDVDLERREHVERATVRIIGWSFLALAAYVLYDAAKTLWLREQPERSVPGIIILAMSVIVMPVLARAKRRVARGLSSRALESDAQQTSLCAYLSIIALAGVALNAALGWWWADPVAALAMVPIIAREGLEGVRGEACADDCCR